MQWLARAVAEKRRFVITFTPLVWGGLMVVLFIWLGVGQGLRDPAHWAFLTALTLVGAYVWTILMWHLFVKPQMDAIDLKRQPRER
jgi:thiol:disulfide interchange protein